MTEMSELLRDLAQDSQRCLENAVNKAIWDSLSQTVRTGVLTSEMCIRSLDTDNSRVDFSAAIMPLMKVLENELIHRFYLPYKNYLRTHFSAEAYVEINELVNPTIRPEDARRKILFCDRNGRYGYTSDRNRQGTTEFTLGNYAFTVGVERLFRNKCDKTAVLFL